MLPDKASSNQTPASASSASVGEAVEAEIVQKILLDEGTGVLDLIRTSPDRTAKANVKPNSIRDTLMMLNSLRRR
jgi:hypothetical protein